MYSDLTAIILSVGKSYRMGKMLKIGKKTIIERVHDQMLQIFKNVIR